MQRACPGRVGWQGPRSTIRRAHGGRRVRGRGRSRRRGGAMTGGNVATVIARPPPWSLRAHRGRGRRGRGFGRDIRRACTQSRGWRCNYPDGMGYAAGQHTCPLQARMRTPPNGCASCSWIASPRAPTPSSRRGTQPDAGPSRAPGKFQVMRDERRQTISPLAGRKLAGKAGGFLMRLTRVDEGAACKATRHMAMDGNIRLADLARTPTAATELFQPRRGKRGP
ncbi:MAG: hypothetical protein NFCOHLIN_00431 [Gammaproteobacteria bacterium]|nr:hypothetical protein [Gammaproteobacteria bacterium]